MAIAERVHTNENIPTTILGGQRLAKDHLRVEAVGLLDELNVFAGGVRTGLSTDPTVPSPLRETLLNELCAAQECLIEVLEAVSNGKGGAAPSPADRKSLEESIASLEKAIKPAPRAILPGGVPTTTRLHMSRTLCDRAERSVVALSRQEPVSDEVLQYLERLSVWFFVTARVVAAETGKEWFYN